jgi:hypothetical protein
VSCFGFRWTQTGGCWRIASVRSLGIHLSAGRPRCITRFYGGEYGGNPPPVAPRFVYHSHHHLYNGSAAATQRPLPLQAPLPRPKTSARPGAATALPGVTGAGKMPVSSRSCDQIARATPKSHCVSDACGRVCVSLLFGHGLHSGEH